MGKGTPKTRYTGVMKKLHLLSEATLEKRKLLLKAVTDYFGEKIPEDSFKRIVAALKSGSTLGLDEDERKAAWAIKTNLEDEMYRNSLALDRAENSVA